MEKETLSNHIRLGERTSSVSNQFNRESFEFQSKEVISKYLMNALNALFEDEIENKNYVFLQHLANVFNAAQYSMPIISEATNRTFRDTLEDAILFEIARCFTTAIIKNPVIGYEALDKIFSLRYPLFKNANMMTNDELYKALYQSNKSKKVGSSIYGAVCCCMFLKPDPTDERWIDFIHYQRVVYDNCSIHSTKELIEEKWGIDDLYENKIFMRFVKKRREDLASFLKCGETKLHLFLFHIVFEHIEYKNSKNTKPQKKELQRFSEKLFDKLEVVCKKNVIGMQWLIPNTENALPELLDECINQSLCEIVWSKYIEKQDLGEEFNISMLIRNVMIENPVEFLKDVITIFFFEVSAKALNKCLDFTHENFSIDKFLRCDSSSLLKAKVSEYGTIITEKDNSLENQEREIESLNLRIQQLEKQLSHETAVQASESEKKLNKNERLREKIAAYEEYFSLQDAKDEILEDSEDKVDISEISDKRMLFIGGRSEVVQKLKFVFPSSVFVQDEVRKISFIDFERVIMFPKFMNHSLFYKYITRTRRQGIKAVFCNANNLEQVHRKILTSFQEAS